MSSPRLIEALTSTTFRYTDIAAETDALMRDVRAAAEVLTGQHGYTLAALADLTGLHKNSLMRLQDVDWHPKLETLQRLELVLAEATLITHGVHGSVTLSKRGRPQNPQQIIITPELVAAIVEGRIKGASEVLMALELEAPPARKQPVRRKARAPARKKRRVRAKKAAAPPAPAAKPPVAVKPPPRLARFPKAMAKKPAKPKARLVKRRMMPKQRARAGRKVAAH